MFLSGVRSRSFFKCRNRERVSEVTSIDQDNLLEVLDELIKIVHGRWDHDPEQSYTAKLLTGHEDKLLKKIGEESCEVVMAAKDNDKEHLAYEAGDLLYHLLVVLERYGVSSEDLAKTLAERM